jgi:HAD superfamily hydrolase (TIGR01549 family)
MEFKTNKMNPILLKKYWIFDMDGTLTISMHDFDEFKSKHKFPIDKPLLESINALTGGKREKALQKLENWEEEIGRRSVLGKDTLELLDYLNSQEKEIAILTRNTRKIALITLEATKIIDYFNPDLILGRDSAIPKPSPEGIMKILKIWGAKPEQAVMVGDFIFDIQAGLNAGTSTIYISREPFPTPCMIADLSISSFTQLFR